MNKASLITTLSDQLDISRKMAEECVEKIQDIIIHELCNNHEVTLAGFGTFSPRVRSARKGVNPRKPSEIIDVPEVRVPKFKAGNALKKALKRKI